MKRHLRPVSFGAGSQLAQNYGSSFPYTNRFTPRPSWILSAAIISGFIIAVVGDGVQVCSIRIVSSCLPATDFLAQTNFLIITSHAYFQVFTSIFVTDSPLDVIFNALAVIILDVFIDPSFNRTRYFGIFFFSALLGNALTLLIGPSFGIFSSAGASGGIFGLYAATFAYKWAEEKRIDRGTLALFAAIFVSSSVLQNVNWVAHVGGSIGGFITGPALYLALRGRLAGYQPVSDSANSTRIIVWTSIILLIIASSVQFYAFISG